MPPNCVQDPTKECLGYAEAQILRHQIEELSKKQTEYQEKNSKDHKEFYERLEAGDRAQAVCPAHCKGPHQIFSHGGGPGALVYQLAEILSDTNEIKSDLKERARELTNAITELRMKPAKKWDNLSDKVLFTLVSALIGAALAYIGLGGLV